MAAIILCTLNARYIHSSLGLRYLLANMGPLQADTTLLEYNINSRPLDIVENLLSHHPSIIGFSVYIWNAEQIAEIVKLIKTIAPEITLVIGGPEVSYEYEQQEIVATADYLITGQADLAFAELCESLLNNQPPATKIIHPLPVDVKDIKLPYEYYTDTDVAQRIIYVEASRGCPFKCEFCLSALDKTVYPFDLDIFLTEMQKLYERGVKHFKFVDRTFNLKVDSSIRIMEFFLDKNDDELFLHFELIPDHLPEKLKATISRFPAHSLQFEIGIQSLNPQVQQLITRKQNTEKTRDNLNWIHQHSNAHIHADLIIGLPGEDIDSFARGFNELSEMNPHEIQVGILKRLRGTPIIRHTTEFDMRFSPYPPYNILSNNLIDFASMQRLNRFARYWDIIANSGRFKHSKPLLLGRTPFEYFMQLSDWLFQKTGQTHKFSLERIFILLYEFMTEVAGLDKAEVDARMHQDYNASGIKGHPKFLMNKTKSTARKSPAGLRQKRHQH
ncbi:MAG: B12-binding domain-containing radical SAM protein [Gammaproteobacteria bacterium]|nr:B12-binding domain-containing radical SAM protein [Gammaproteobacteria bacterium]